MSQHPSLRMDSVGAKHRNVLKRYERVKKLEEQSKWGDRTSVFALPKVKSMKVKVKKVKETPAEGAAAGAAQPGAPQAPGASAKPGAAAQPTKAAASSAAKTDKGKK